MKDEAIENPPKPEAPKPRQLGIWTRFWKAYQYKKHTDQSFLATIVALQVLLFAVIFIGVLFFVFQKSQMGSLGSSLLFRQL